MCVIIISFTVKKIKGEKEPVKDQNILENKEEKTKEDKNKERKMYRYQYKLNPLTPQGIVEIKRCEDGIIVRRTVENTPMISAIDLMKIDDDNNNGIAFGVEHISSILSRITVMINTIHIQEDSKEDDYITIHKVKCDLSDCEWEGVTQSFFERSAVTIYKREIFETDSDRMREIPLDDREQIW